MSAAKIGNDSDALLSRIMCYRQPCGVDLKKIWLWKSPPKAGSLNGLFWNHWFYAQRQITPYIFR